MYNIILILFLKLNFCIDGVVMSEELSKKYGQAVNYSKKNPLSFVDFSITYVKEVDPEEGSKVKTTASIRVKYFKIIGKKGEENIELRITHGQLPPKPQVFRVEGTQYTIYTYNSPQGDRLFPDNLLIEKNSSF